MKILLASDTWSPMVNGVVRSVELLYHQLLALGHDVRGGDPCPEWPFP